MARERTGSLELRGGIWHVRVTVTRDAKSVREWYTLDTPDYEAAKRRKAPLSTSARAAAMSGAK